MRNHSVIIGLIAILAWQFLCSSASASRPTGEQAEASRTPWSGWWWPLLDSRNPNLYDDGGPLDKYDAYVQRLGWGNPGTQAWEYANHRTTDPDAGWWGHCHAWSAAAVLEPEPLAAGYDAGIYFTVSDLKGLVTEAYYSPEAEDYGNRYNGRAGDDFQDIYPGLFHTVLRYYIEQQRVAIVADIDPGEQVWNYPAYAYRMEFTPDTRYSNVTHVLARVWYADDGVDPNYAGTQALIKDYTYWLQTSGSEIIASGWEGDSRNDHPDFLWAPNGRDPGATAVNLDVVRSILESQPAQGCNEYLPNGDFETGDFAPWVALGSTQLTERDTVNAWLGGYDNADDVLYQTLAIPRQATVVSLSYAWAMTTRETEHAYDFLKVTVRDAGGQVLQTLETLDDGRPAGVWNTSRFDLRAYAGRTIRIYFQATTDDSNVTSFYLDDVSLNVCTGAVATPTPPPRPTATPTVGPAPAGCHDVIDNGDFETGDFTGWEAGNAWTHAGYQPEVTDLEAHTGTYSAWLGGYEDANDLMVQRVIIPSRVSRARLSYWWLMETDEVQHPHDFLYVRLLDSAGNELATIQTLDDGATPGQWRSSGFDLSRFAGRAVQLSFLTTGDASDITSFFIDDVQFEVCSRDTPPTATPVPRAWAFLPIILKKR
jgi:hypothetical protein